jgi:hypothetical protein
MLTRRTATVTISAPDASTAAAFCSKLLYLPVPTMSRDVKVRPATIQVSLLAAIRASAFTAALVLMLRLAGDISRLGAQASHAFHNCRERLKLAVRKPEEEMRIVGIGSFVLTVLGAMPLAAQERAPAPGPQAEQEVVVRGESARREIERILREDSLTSIRPTPREVAETMAVIVRGNAPQDFWSAYQTHVLAWQRYADAIEQAPRDQGESNFGPEGAAEEAQQAIESTFVEVERIARRYGARLPAAPIDPRTVA